jgi:hypothetical protein
MVWDYEHAKYNLFRDKLSEYDWDLDNKNVDDQINEISKQVKTQYK